MSECAVAAKAPLLQEQLRRLRLAGFSYDALLRYTVEHVERHFPLGAFNGQDLVDIVEIVVSDDRFEPRYQVLSDRFSIDSLSSSEFASGEYRVDYLIDGFLTEKQPCIIGGAPKSLKTSIGVDLAVSLSSGREFLNRFKVLKTVNVGFISGESGRATIQDTARRVCDCKGLQLADQAIEWAFDIPQISDPTHLDALSNFIFTKDIEVLLLDPVYLALLSQENANSAGNVFSMGAVLRGFSEIINSLDTTLILVHHISKGASRANKLSRQAPELEDLSMAGFAEFARQWILLGNRSPYLDGSGLHQLWLRYGGSAGHGGLVGVDVRQGSFMDIGGRKWAVTTRDASEIEAEIAEQAEVRKSERVEKQFEIDIEKLISAATQYPNGETRSVLYGEANLNGKRGKAVADHLVDDGRLVECVVKKGREYPGLRLSRSLGHSQSDTVLTG